MPGYRSRMPCGCEVRIGMESASIVNCPVHAAAPELLLAAKDLLARLDAREPHEISTDGLRACVAKAAGRS